MHSCCHGRCHSTQQNTEAIEEMKQSINEPQAKNKLNHHFHLHIVKRFE